MSYTPGQPFLVAAAQVSPVFLDRDATIDRACATIGDAAARGARLVLFPEAFVPGYPLWVWSVAAGQPQMRAPPDPDIRAWLTTSCLQWLRPAQSQAGIAAA